MKKKEHHVNQHNGVYLVMSMLPTVFQKILTTNTHAHTD